MDIEEKAEQVIGFINSLGRDLSNEEYGEFLEKIRDELGARLDALKETTK